MKRILVAPLDWGLGHATRCIPIIRNLQARNFAVAVAGSGDSLLLLKAEFPSLSYFSIPAYDPRYPSQGPMALKMMGQIPKFFAVIRKEHNAIEKIVTREKIAMVISDNRYGCWSSNVPCIFITHQSNILMPKRFGWLQGTVRRLNHRYMRKFTRCWIPDFPDDPNLAGELISFGNTDHADVDYIGPLSRFKPRGTAKKKYDIVAVFSGPEPQRTLMEKKVMPQLERSNFTYFVVRGVPSGTSKTKTHADFLSADDLQEVIESSDVILARSGYSTVMDLAVLGKKAIFIPTPGQTEQEYLAKKLFEKKIAFSMEQERFDLSLAIEASKNFTGFVVKSFDDSALNRALDRALNAI